VSKRDFFQTFEKIVYIMIITMGKKRYRGTLVQLHNFVLILTVQRHSR